MRELAAAVTARVFPGVNAMLCLEGEWIRVQDGVEHHVRAGDFWQTPPNVPRGLGAATLGG